MEKVVTRFPPSPTGNLHIGGAHTALFNYLFAKHHGGTVHLRLENTDEERSKPEYEKNIVDSLGWLGLEFDPIGNALFWRQSERKEVYRGYLDKLVEGGKAYVSKEDERIIHQSEERQRQTANHFQRVDTTPASEDGSTPFVKGDTTPSASECATPLGKGDRAEVIRFRNPNKKIAFEDIIRGRIEFDTAELGDFVIAKSVSEPLYHLAVVVDDHEMGITHVIRGEDHISNTPRQILLGEALGFRRPMYAHIPLILAPDRSKLSKRHGAVSVTEYREKGYIPEALINYLALLGWNPGTDKEIFSLDELVGEFDLAKVQKGGAVFNVEKLRWFNKEYLRVQGGAEQLLSRIPSDLAKGKSKAQLNALSHMLFERVSVAGDIEEEMKRGEFDYVLRALVFDRELLRWREQTTEDLQKQLAAVSEIIRNRSDDGFSVQEIKAAVLPYAEREGKGNVLWPFRVALSGREKSPDPFTLAAILGQKETLSRLTAALNMLQ